MAVTLISTPSPSPDIVSVSYPFLCEVSSDTYGTAGVTQHRFVGDMIGVVDLGKKYTIVSQPPNRGIFDFSSIFKTQFVISPQESGVSTNWITQATTPTGTKTDYKQFFNIQFNEQYYLNGVFTTELGPIETFTLSRGYSADPDHHWDYFNWNSYNGLEKFISYSGRGHQVYPVVGFRDSWDTNTYDNVTFEIVRQDDVPLLVNTYPIDDFDSNPVVYLRMCYPTYTDHPAFEYIRIRVWLGIGGSTKLVLDQAFTIYKTVVECEDEDVVVMFQDRFYQWSFMHFNRKHTIIQSSESVPAESPRGEIPEGRYRYNVDTSDVLQLNTNWVDEIQNDLMRDLVATTDAYLVDQDDGSLERVVVQQNSLTIKTSRNDGLMQYGLIIRKSVDNFAP